MNKLWILAACVAAIFGFGVYTLATPDTVYDVRVYKHDGNGSGTAMVAFNEGPLMYTFQKRPDGTTQFCLEDVVVETCFTTEDEFNARSTELHRLNFKAEW